MKPNFDEFWKLETIGINDDQANQNFHNTVRKTNGRYEVTWQWKKANLRLPDNYQLALGRLNSLLKRIQGKLELLQKYDSIIKDQLKKEIIKEVNDRTEEGSKRHYIPQHAVITPDRKTTNARIVYDASAKARKGCKSLNECLYRDPVILEDLYGHLLLFRIHKVALTADIETAFVQVGLQPTDRDVTKFLWLKDPTKPLSKDNLQIYRFTRVPFGVISSPFLLGATMHDCPPLRRSWKSYFEEDYETHACGQSFDFGHFKYHWPRILTLVVILSLSGITLNVNVMVLIS